MKQRLVHTKGSDPDHAAARPARSRAERAQPSRRANEVVAAPGDRDPSRPDRVAALQALHIAPTDEIRRRAAGSLRTSWRRGVRSRVTRGPAADGREPTRLLVLSPTFSTIRRFG